MKAGQRPSQPQVRYIPHWTHQLSPCPLCHNVRKGKHQNQETKIPLGTEKTLLCSTEDTVTQDTLSICALHSNRLSLYLHSQKWRSALGEKTDNGRHICQHSKKEKLFAFHSSPPVLSLTYNLYSPPELFFSSKTTQGNKSLERKYWKIKANKHFSINSISTAFNEQMKLSSTTTPVRLNSLFIPHCSC